MKNKYLRYMGRIVSKDDGLLNHIKGFYSFSKDLGRVVLVSLVLGGAGWVANDACNSVKDEKYHPQEAIVRGDNSLTIDNKYKLYYDTNLSDSNLAVFKKIEHILSKPENKEKIMEILNSDE